MRDLYELLRDIEAAGAYPRGSTKQAQALARVVAQYETKAKRLQPEQAAIYDQLFLALSDGAGRAARAHLSRTLAGFVRSPRAIVERLAASEDAEVAAPLLERAPTLQEDLLLAVAETGGDAHLSAIARRASLVPRLSGIVATRGGEPVVETLALNPGAVFDAAGHATLAARSAESARVRAAAICRADLPEHYFSTLLARDLSCVCADLDTRGGARKIDAVEIVSLVASALADASRERYDRERLDPHVAYVARRIDKRAVEERHFARWLELRQTEDAIALLSARSLLPPALVQRILFAESPLPTAILARGLGFGWTTLKALSLGAFPNASIADQSALYEMFDALDPQNARAVVRHAALRHKIRIFPMDAPPAADRTDRLRMSA